MPLALLNLTSLLHFSFFLRDKSIHPHTNRANLFLTKVEKQFNGEILSFQQMVLK